MKRIFYTLIAAMALTCATAAPVRKAVTTYTQPDGSVITLRLCGDEFYHFYTTEDGTPVTKCEDGFYRYTTLDKQNNLVASNVKVGDAFTGEIASRESIAMQHRDAHQTRRISKNNGIKSRRAPMQQAGQTADSDGKVRGLILLVEFQDYAFKISQENVYNMMNKEGYTDKYGSIGSARDYFIAQSYGQFKPDFDVIGPITLSRDMSYYGGNDRYGNDAHPDEMVSEACEIASKNELVNMADYDLNKDGWVDLVYAIYAGYGENIGGVDEDAIWPHAWYIYQGAQRTVEIDGVKLDAYACSSELANSSGTKPDGIGTFCHEYSHTLGLPDWYDIDYSGGMGMDAWSVMDAGCYAGDGYIPIGYNAYERAYCGWLELNELTDPTTITMPFLDSDKSAAYRISSTDENQYITLETRKKEGWDFGLPAEGMMVVAVDYDKRAWDHNGPNDTPSRQRFKLIPADNRWSTYDLEGDLFPYKGNNTLTDSSSPKMKVYNTTITGKPITNINYADGVTTFDFMGGKGAAVEAPVATSAGEISTSQFTAYWSKVDEAISYTLYVERIEESDAPAIAFEENFDKFTESSDLDISSSLDDYTMTPGWSGSKVFCSNGKMKLGSSKYPGDITTPKFKTEKQFTVSFTADAYNKAAESGVLTIRVDGATSASCDIDMSQLPSGESREVRIAYEHGGDEVSITLEANRRIFIDNFTVNNGIEREATMGKARVSKAKEMSNVVSITESRTIEGITDTHYTVTEVETPIHEGLYRYKVCAVTADGTSRWSNVINVKADDKGAVESVVANADVYSANGRIYIKADNATATVYNMQGVAVATIALDGDVTSYSPATSGIYLVRCGNSVSKVAVQK